MREPISLKDIIAVVVKRGRMIVCFMIVAALLLGGYKALDNRTATNNEVLEQEYQSQLDSYNQTKKWLEEDLQNAKHLYEIKKAYHENSIVMRLEPYNLYKSVSVFLITIGETDNIKSNSNTLEDLRYITSVVQHCYSLLWNTSDLGAAFDVDLENQYLQEVVCLESTDHGALVLTVFGNTEEETEKLANKAGTCLLNMYDAVCDKTYKHNIVKFNQLVEHSSNSVFADHQKEMDKQLTESKETVEDLQAQLAALKEPTAEGAATLSITGLVKWMVIGAFVGLALGCVWTLVLFVMFSRVESSKQMEATLGIPFLGTTAGRRDLFCRLGEKIMGEAQWADRSQAESFVAENIRAMGVQEGLAILTTLRTKDANTAVEKAVQVLNPVCGEIRYAVDAQSNSNAVEILGNCKYLLIAERVGVSDVSKMLSLLNTANRLGVVVLGFVTI